MNIKESLNRETLLATSVLLVALGLPLSTSALELSAIGDSAEEPGIPAKRCVQRTPMKMDQRAPAESVGFAETDPTGQQFRYLATAPQAFVDRESLSIAGFAETDPAFQHIQDAVVFARAFDNSVLQQLAGFAETDPATSSFRMQIWLRC